MASTLAAAALLWSAADTASAIGADAGTTVSNTASVVYTVNAVVQPAVASNAADFVVDRLVDLTVTAIPVTYVSVTPAADGAFLFSVANTSNATLGFDLITANNATDPFGGTDNFDPTTLTAVVDAGVLGTYEPGVDVATTMDTVVEDGTFGVWVVAAIPGGQGNLDIAAITLTATAREPGAGGAALVEEVGAEDPLVMETVFGDGVGDTDAANDASYSDSGAYQVASADVTITKTETLISDPINAGVNPRHIPGAVVEYEVTVTNDALSAFPATTLTISDVLPGDVTFATDTYGAGFGIDLDGLALSNAVDADAGSEAGGTVTVTVPTLAAGASAVITFQVTVN
ncbi:MAG: hypothetical protein WEF50_13880 [Myxococcota bacterium]